MNKSFFFTVLAILGITLASGLVIFFAKGYTFNPSSGIIQKTGSIVITSEPKDAAIYLDDALIDTTNKTINFLAPKIYKVRVTKDGFTPWEKDIVVRPELVTQLDLTLFTQVPDPRRLTFTGASQVIPTPDGEKIVYRVTEKQKSGLWVMGISDRLIFQSTDPIQIYKDTGIINLDKATFLIAPDGKTMLATDATKTSPSYYLLDLERSNDNPIALALQDVETRLLSWHDTLWQKQISFKDRLLASTKSIPAYENQQPDLTPLITAIDGVLAKVALTEPTVAPDAVTGVKAATRPAQPSISANAAQLADRIPNLAEKITYLYDNAQWSPNGKRALFSTDSKTKVVYDFTTGTFYDLPKAESYHWFPTSAHLIMLNPEGKENEIVISDYDGRNRVLVFSGQFVDNIAIPWGTGTRLVILTNLNQAANTEPNLYAINLR